MLKDAHLIEAALATDRVVVSLDEAVRRCFRDACPQVSQLRDVLWANPAAEPEDVEDWLLRGARSQKHRTLGSG